MFPYDVLCIGSATLDHFIVVDEKIDCISLGDKILVDKREFHTGGGGTNAAISLKKLGIKTKILTKLGNDEQAKYIQRELQKFKIKNICLNKSKKPTNTSTIINSIKGKDRVIFTYKGASSDLTKRDYKKSSLNSSWIYLASLTGKSLQTAKQIVSYTNNSILFNPSLYLVKQRRKIMPILKKSTILILNKKEAQVLLDTQENSLKKLLNELSNLGPNTIIITQGGKRFAALNFNQYYFITPPKLEPLCTAGAGDAFASGLLAAIIKGESFKNALELGQLNALSVIQKIGTKEGLLNYKKIEKIKKKHKIKITS